MGDCAGRRGNDTCFPPRRRPVLPDGPATRGDVRLCIPTAEGCEDVLLQTARLSSQSPPDASTRHSNRRRPGSGTRPM